MTEGEMSATTAQAELEITELVDGPVTVEVVGYAEESEPLITGEPQEIISIANTEEIAPAAAPNIVDFEPTGDFSSVADVIPLFYLAGSPPAAAPTQVAQLRHGTDAAFAHGIETRGKAA